MLHGSPKKEFSTKTKLSLLLVIVGVPIFLYLSWDTLAGTLINTSLQRDNLDDGLVVHYTFDGSDVATDNKVGEAGTFSSAADGGWTTINFNRDYGDPPVVVGTVNTDAGANEGIIFEVRNVTGSSAEMRLCRLKGVTQNGCDTLTSQTAGYLVVDVDASNLLGGIEAGTVSVSNNTNETVNFTESFGTAPIVLTSVQTDNASPDVPSETWANSVGTGSVTIEKCHLDSDNNCDTSHVAESVGWVALEPGNLPWNQTAEVGTISITDGSWGSVIFTETYPSAPVVIATSQTQNGGQDPLIDEARSITTSGAQTRVCEIDSANTCGTHNSEDVGWLAVSSGDLSGTKTVIDAVLDTSGNSNTGTLNGFGAVNAASPGKIGQGLEFDGVDDYVDFTSPSFSDVTVSAWIKPNQLETQVMLNLYDGSKNVRLFMDLNGVLQLDTVPGEIGNAIKGGITADAWNHVVGVYDSSAQTAVVYVDGIPGTVETSVTGFGTGGDASQVGAQTSAFFFDGIIDDVRIYDRALSAREIEQLYHLGGTTKINTSIQRDNLDAGLQGHWTMDGSTISYADGGPKLLDRSGSNNDGVPYTEEYTEANLIGYWTLDDVDTDSSTTTDRSGNGYDGELNGDPAGTTTSKVREARYFDGTGDYFRINGFLGSPSNATLAGWVNLNSTGSGGDDFISLGDNLLLRLDQGSGQGVIGHFYNSGWHETPTGQFIAGTGWRHVAYTFDDAANEQRVYIDGVLASSTSYTQSITYPLGSDTYIGRHGSSNQRHLSGYADDIRVYSRALSAEEIKELMVTGAKHRQGTVPGKIGQALEFDGVDDYLRIPHSSSINISGDAMAISAWVKNNDAKPDTGTEFIVDKTNDNTSAYRLFLTSGEWRFRIYNSGGATNCDTSGITFGANEWQHVTGVYDGSNLYVYVNGVEEAKCAHTGNVTTNMEPLDIGARDHASVSFWDGTIDDVRIYDRALSAREIKQLYHLGGTTKIGTTLTPENLGTGQVGHWTMDGNDVAVNVSTTGSTTGIAATGGTVTTDGDYKVHTFTSSGTFQITSGSGNVDYLVVGGGGGGGSRGGGGGGAGEFKTGTLSLSPSSITITVGSGGSGQSAGNKNTASNGNNSVIGGYVTSLGGGGGGSDGDSSASQARGNSGGSGGGGTASGGSPDGVGRSGGSANGTGFGSGGGKGKFVDQELIAGGGGGGANQSGNNGAGTVTSNSKGGNGGNGRSSSITGTSITYAGGGGGGVFQSGTPGWGGSGGGGNGAKQDNNGQNGTDGRGGGGGGGGIIGSTQTGSGGDGGDGVVILRYLDQTTTQVETKTVEIQDISGSGNNATASGTTFAVGKIGQALEFDGVDDYVDLGNVATTSQLALTDRITLAAWIKTETATGDIVGRDDQASKRQYNIHVTDGTNSAKVYLDGTTVTGVTDVTDNDWHHVVATWDKDDSSGSNIRLYVDGVEDATGNRTTALPNYDTAVEIGRRGTAYFMGAIDDVRIYDYALSAQEVQQLYELGQ